MNSGGGGTGGSFDGVAGGSMGGSFNGVAGGGGAIGIPSDGGIAEPPFDPDDPEFDPNDPNFDDGFGDDDVASDDFPDDGQGGSGPIGSGGSNGFEFGEVVEAQLVSDAIQFVFVEANGDSFAFYDFRIGNDVVQFGPGRINVLIGVDEGEPSCIDPIAVERRALFETTTLATSFFSLRAALSAIATNESFETTPDRLFGELIDTYATADQGRLSDAIHCGDEMTNGVPTLNGFPIECNRAEANQFDNLDSFFSTAIVNRFDLAPANGAHCGQQRLIFASNAQNRMFFILEAQVPNPAPEFGILGCQPIVDFWAAQAQIEDAFFRGIRLQEAFLLGSPELLAQGVGPFMSASNLTVGSGQIRTNQFDSIPWTLREFKLAIDGSALRAVPLPVSEAPNGQLWNDSIDTPQGPACRDAFIQALPNLLTNNLEEMSFPVPQECKDAESRNDGSQDYPFQMLGGNPDGFQAQLATALEGTGLTPFEVATRAQFAGSCIGCHEEAVGRDLGFGIIAPFSNGFVHVSEFASSECRDGDCFDASQAVEEVFIPRRFEVLSQFAFIPTDPFCEGIFFPVPPPPADQPVAPEPAPEFEPELPSVDTPVEEIIQQDEEIRELFGDETLGGQDADRTH
jgi:hypothetical protein